MVEDRRSSTRVRAYRPVRLHLPQSPRVVETLTKDISMGGMCCLSSSTYPVSSQMNVELILATGEGPIVALGRTAWFRSIPYSEQFDVGISFTDMAEQDKRRLSACLGRLSQKFPLIPA